MLNKIPVSEMTYGETYRNAKYSVTTPSGYVGIQIGVPNNELDALLAKDGVNEACLMTAFNPLGQKVDDNINARANQALESSIQAMSLPYYLGLGQDPKGDWQEESYLIMGIDIDGAKQLGKQYQQNAFVWIAKLSAPELVWLR